MDNKTIDRFVNEINSIADSLYNIHHLRAMQLKGLAEAMLSYKTEAQEQARKGGA